MKVKIHPSALGDLRDAIHWYESQRAGLGAEFFAVIDAAFAKIASNPFESQFSNRGCRG